ncbi:hypothetical protein IH779_02335 [Patescibacteria group bacterium]|nr:hypothetical protein [Patescibacteria group bacterium]
MKYILLLYLIQPYVDVRIGEESPETKARFAALYKKIVRERYPGFQVVCVFFSEPGEKKKPDISQMWDLFSLEENYTIGACGVTFTNHCDKREYPKESDILALCPDPIDELVVSGFHFSDCVESIAKYAHEQGIQVFVDEDLTELFFYGIDRGIPISREASIRRTRRLLNKSLLQNFARKNREGRPWLVQP